MEGSSANLRSQSDCQIDVNKKSWLSQLSPHCLLKVDPKGASRHQNLPIAACNLKADTYLTLLLGRDDDWVSSNGVLRDWWRISCPNTKIISWLITPDWGKRLLEANKDIRDFPFHCIECVCNQLRCRTWCTLYLHFESLKNFWRNQLPEWQDHEFAYCERPESRNRAETSSLHISAPSESWEKGEWLISNFIL